MKIILIAIISMLFFVAPVSAHNNPCPGKERVIATLHADVVGSTITETLIYGKRFRNALINYSVVQWEGGQLVLIFKDSTPTTATLVVNGNNYSNPQMWDTYQYFHEAVFCS